MGILITEDDAALGEALRHALTHNGYAVDWVQNGATADKSLRDDVFVLFRPRPDPLFLPPPSSLFTVAQARRAASRPETPRFS